MDRGPNNDIIGMTSGNIMGHVGQRAYGNLQRKISNITFILYIFP